MNRIRQWFKDSGAPEEKGLTRPQKVARWIGLGILVVAALYILHLATVL